MDRVEGDERDEEDKKKGKKKAVQTKKAAR
jgi:hypothetical protein